MEQQKGSTSKEMIWALRWSVALRTFYRQILSLLYSSFPFGNFRPRLVRALLVSWWHCWLLLWRGIQWSTWTQLQGEGRAVPCQQWRPTFQGKRSWVSQSHHGDTWTKWYEKSRAEVISRKRVIEAACRQERKAKGKFQKPSSVRTKRRVNYPRTAPERRHHSSEGGNVNLPWTCTLMTHVRCCVGLLGAISQSVVGSIWMSLREAWLASKCTWLKVDKTEAEEE